MPVLRGRHSIPVRKARVDLDKRPTGARLSASEQRLADTIIAAAAAIPNRVGVEAISTGDVRGYDDVVRRAYVAAIPFVAHELYGQFVESGRQAALDLGQQLAADWRKVGKAATPSQIAASFRFNEFDPRALDWVRREAGDLVTNMVRQDQLAIRQLVEAALDRGGSLQSSTRPIFDLLRTVNPSAGPAAFAQALGINLNGLTVRYERAVIGRVGTLASDLAARGVTGQRAIAQLQSEADKYSTRLRRARAQTIARTERLRAHNEARLLSWNQAIDNGLMDRQNSRKVWVTGFFDVCPVCTPMQGQERAMNEPFQLPNGSMPMTPPGHPNCRCTMRVRTDVRLTNPAQATGGNLLTDPNLLRPGGVSPEGARLAATPFEMPPQLLDEVIAEALEDVIGEIIEDVAGNLAISGIDEARQVAARIPTTAQHRPTTQFNDLVQSGLVQSDRLPLPHTHANGYADGVLNLQLTDEGSEVVDAIMSTGARARQLIDDEIARLTSGASDELLRIDDELATVKRQIRWNDALEFDEQRAAIRQTYLDLADSMSDDANRLALRQLVDNIKFDEIAGEPSNFVSSRWQEQMLDIVRRERDSFDVQRFLVDRVFSNGIDDWLDDALRLLDNGVSLTDEILDDMLLGTRVSALIRMSARPSAELRATLDNLRERAANLVASRTPLVESISGARAQATENVLMANRPDFGTGDILPNFDEIKGKTGISKSDIVDALGDYNRRVPREWIESYKTGFRLAFTKRGFFSWFESKIRVSPTSAAGGWRSVLTHEITHGHQYFTPRIQLAERLFLSKRAQEIGDSAFAPKKYMSDKERRYELGLGDAYTTKIYSDRVTELSTRASEMVWYGLPPGASTDLLDFWLGVLLLV